MTSFQLQISGLQSFSRTTTMAGRSFEVGQRVDVVGKDVKGVIAYMGATSFAPGQWIGLVLDEPKGKNNGSIQGVTYFNVRKEIAYLTTRPQPAYSYDFISAR